MTWLLDEDRQLRGIPFAEVIFDTTGKRVLPVNPKDQIDQRVIRRISAVCDETIKRFTVQSKNKGRFQGSNHDMYLPEAIVAGSAK